MENLVIPKKAMGNNPSGGLSGTNVTKEELGVCGVYINASICEGEYMVIYIIPCEWPFLDALTQDVVSKTLN